MKSKFHYILINVLLLFLVILSFTAKLPYGQLAISESVCGKNACGKDAYRKEVYRENIYLEPVETHISLTEMPFSQLPHCLYLSHYGIYDTLC